MNTATNDSQTQTAISNDNSNANGAAGSTEATQVQFKVGWSYDVFLKKNGFAPSATASETWHELSRTASKAQVALIAQLSGAGAKTKCSAKAVFNKKDGRFDTALTARVVQPGCKDMDMITEALVKAQARASKALSDMRAAAIGQGALEVALS